MGHEEITPDIVDQAMNLTRVGLGLIKGQVDEEFEINYPLIEALEE